MKKKPITFNGIRMGQGFEPKKESITPLKRGVGNHMGPPKKKKRISKNTAYKRGRAFEYRVQNHFRKLGYYVKRSYASKGAEDLLAIKSIELIGSSPKYTKTFSECFLIQCKNLKVEKPLSKLEKDNLKALAKQTGATPLLAKNVNHKLVIEEIE